MENDVKMDSIWRIILVVFVGLLVFLFLFEGVPGEYGHYGEGSTSHNYLLNGLISFLLNVLVSVLALSLIGGLFMGLRKLFDQKSNILGSSQFTNAIQKDPVLKTLLSIIAGLFVLYFIVMFVRCMEFGGGFGFFPYQFLFVLIGFLFKILTLILVITLTLALLQYLKIHFTNADTQTKASTSNSQINNSLSREDKK